MAVQEAKKYGKSIAICGVMASNPLFTALFLGLGIQELSCAPRFIPLIKRVVRNCTIREAHELAERVMALTISAITGIS
jgi:phosphotransferase system enzyme I (PtsI)